MPDPYEVTPAPGDAGAADAGAATDASSTPGDAGSATDAGSASDSAADAPVTDGGSDGGQPPPHTCSTGLFGDITPLGAPVHSANGEEFGRMTDDQLELYFDRFASGSYSPAIYHASRASRQDGWANVAPITEVNGIGAAAAPIVAGGTTMYLSIFDGLNGPSNTNLYVSTRAGPGALWSTPAALANVNGTGIDDAPWITRDQGTLYWMKGPPPYIIVASASPFAAFKVVEAPQAGAHAPVLSDDELTMYFSSYTPPAANPTGTPLRLRPWKATRPSKQDAFDAPSYVAELDVLTGDTTVTWISKDGCTILFASNRLGDYDLYTATRTQ